ncbi:hypothetical protein HDU76_012262, partial [Blyttiomyces sp. JEL0837]
MSVLTAAAACTILNNAFPTVFNGTNNCCALQTSASTNFKIDCNAANLPTALTIINTFQSNPKDLPETIGSLTSLTDLDLSYNSYIGLIPDSFSNLVNLKYLNLTYNEIIGIENVEKLPSLEIFYLSNTQLKPDLPASIFDGLNNLTKFHASYSGLVSIPDIFDKLPSLEGLDFTGNNLSAIPDSILRCKNLKFLAFLQNKLSGNLPIFSGSMATMTTLELNQNLFTGNLPSEYGNMVAMEYLTLGSNQLSGNIADIFSSLTRLKLLDLGFNKFSGDIPLSILNLPENRTTIYLEDNCFSDSDLSKVKSR